MPTSLPINQPQWRMYMLLSTKMDPDLIMTNWCSIYDTVSHHFETVPSSKSSFMNFRRHAQMRSGQSKLMWDGRVETAEEVKAQLLTEMEMQSKKYYCRVTTLDNIVNLKAKEGEDDLLAWEWLSHLIKTLGEHGMSLEESAVKNQIEHVLQVKQMGWWHCINRKLDGAKPVKRIHANDNPSSSRNAVSGLPMALYDSAWIADLMQCQLDALDVSSNTFDWMMVATAM
ncbi:hypothetical protein J3R82DRAFT_2942 [Butyriboletus roseoflavus]|nr:hypothetical protein J3R82DRAFT_2942 [Butyriboletus roseoflavus]